MTMSDEYEFESVALPAAIGLILLQCKECGRPIARLSVDREHLRSAQAAVRRAEWELTDRTNGHGCRCGRDLPAPWVLPRAMGIIRRVIRDGNASGDWAVNWMAADRTVVW
jgi:Tfp pilus assembly protein PilX